MTKVYLAGPMRGKPNFNFPAFHFAAAKLRQEGYEVFSPAEKGEETILTSDPGWITGTSSGGLQENLQFRRKVFLLDTQYICNEADAVFLLNGWEKSKGAVAERALAEAIGLEVRELEPEYNI